jgi:AcrR family transcriptional regulator
MADRQDTLRDRLKQETRLHIAATAERLFAEHGFRQVTIDAVAQEAGVSRQTVFNHFPVKEDLVFDRGRDLEEQMVAAVRDRSADDSIVDAFRAQHRAFWSRLYSRPDPRPQGGFFSLVDASPPLQAYARELNARASRRLADTIAGSTRQSVEDLRPRVIADALLAVYAATFDAVQRHIVAGEAPNVFLDAVLQQADASFDLLDTGIGSYV